MKDVLKEKCWMRESIVLPKCNNNNNRNYNKWMNKKRNKLIIKMK
jgi:hypothetical protein